MNSEVSEVPLNKWYQRKRLEGKINELGAEGGGTLSEEPSGIRVLKSGLRDGVLVHWTTNTLGSARSCVHTGQVLNYMRPL